ncbi:MAG: 4-hydroxy-3-methylbut-2-enyl diphosphate reductase [Bacteroidota bacterium]|nr:4-hydroxy-3-methylbut-2-enyl diphosphate reductase [Bacteroidota bacterium]MDP4227150.1 4-hydroxy-3-methylbut-2-enyl diphosphate reductase [Bacteroidota bacterium]MDP4275600.1 4-hydroxy-3-methylbut-2-enyl diphosphate reductase [Bacteroidota bacterium]
MLIEIDKNSGFCFGVVKAIEMAEKELKESGHLYCLGEIVHNNVEVNRLAKEGLVTIDFKTFKKLKHCKVLIRAHGEPPETYKIAEENDITIIDATCSVVLKLQKKIKQGYENAKNSENEGQVVIFGKEGHAEVNGLVGQTHNEAIVVNDINDLYKIDFSKPIDLFSQTTQSKSKFNLLKQELIARMSEAGIKPENCLKANDTVCHQVSNREPKLKEFAQNHELVIFVSGQQSSNGKMLYKVCKEANPNTLFISESKEISADLFKNINSVGICGATSTPLWLMEKIADTIKNLTKI